MNFLQNGSELREFYKKYLNKDELDKKIHSEFSSISKMSNDSLLKSLMKHRETIDQDVDNILAIHKKIGNTNKGFSDNVQSKSLFFNNEIANLFKIKDLLISEQEVDLLEKRAEFQEKEIRKDKTFKFLKSDYVRSQAKNWDFN